mgnify:CR=1 FL=1
MKPFHVGILIIISLLHMLSSCNNEEKLTTEASDTIKFLNENEAISGWYSFPFKLCIDSSKYITINSSSKHSTYYDNIFAEENIVSGNALYVDSNLLKGKLLANDSTLMETDLEKWFPIKKWVKPKSKNIKIGVPVFFNDTINNVLRSEIYFDKSKKLEDKALTLSLLIDPKDLIDFETGIYVQGINKDVKKPKKGNYSERGSKWQRKAKAHLFNNKGLLLLASEVGIRTHGNLSRAQPQKSFSLLFNKRFNSNKPVLDVFGKVKKINRLILRTPFCSYMHGQSVLQDPFISNIAKKMNLEAMGFAPTNLYINGEYWGLYYLREKIDEHFLSQEYNVSKKSISIVEFSRSVGDGYLESYGEKSEFISLINFLDTNQLSTEDEYIYLSEKIHINNLIDYLILNTFFANRDWPSNNYKFWKSNELDNKWRFIIQDMDACFFIKDNMFEYILAKNETSGNNISKSTVLFRNVFNNNLFVETFKNRYRELQETLLNPEILNAELDIMATKLDPSIDYQVKRWGMPESKERWLVKINKMKSYFKKRHKIYSRHLSKIR